ncbi:hypothetical protein ACFQ4C_03485 [Larkinella insperata]|uniref:Uncharacterized protein n=1 Tax=Larkinella insperata TaxID=332158 RepID=A0ABW3QJR6_9BACT|nr:hypothetical protein [Larkinella insperata]
MATKETVQRCPKIDKQINLPSEYCVKTGAMKGSLVIAGHRSRFSRQADHQVSDFTRPAPFSRLSPATVCVTRLKHLSKRVTWEKI